jgi:hypothetical protein
MTVSFLEEARVYVSCSWEPEIRHLFVSIALRFIIKGSPYFVHAAIFEG